jgi:hypothetical protein
MAPRSQRGTHRGQWQLDSVGSLDGGLAGKHWRRACRSQGRNSHGAMAAGVGWEPGRWPGRNTLEEGLQKSRRPENKVSLHLPLRALLTVSVGGGTAARTEGQRPAMQRSSLGFMFTSQLKDLKMRHGMHAWAWSLTGPSTIGPLRLHSVRARGLVR